MAKLGGIPDYPYVVLPHPLGSLDEAGIRVSMIAGTSIGALVGGCYLAGKLDELESFARSLTRRGMLRFLDFQFGGSGLIGGMRLSRRLTESLAETAIEDLGRPFVAVATEARSGHEVWLDRRCPAAGAAFWTAPWSIPSPSMSAG